METSGDKNVFFFLPYRLICSAEKGLLHLQYVHVCVCVCIPVHVCKGFDEMLVSAIRNNNAMIGSKEHDRSISDCAYCTHTLYIHTRLDAL